MDHHGLQTRCLTSSRDLLSMLMSSGRLGDADSLLMLLSEEAANQSKRRCSVCDGESVNSQA